MSGENRLQLFAFEVPSSENLLYIPLSVRFHLDRAGLRISLEDWQLLPHEERVVLASFAVPEKEDADGGAFFEDGEHSESFVNRLNAAMHAHAARVPEQEGVPATMPCDDLIAAPDSVARQCEMAGLLTPDPLEWSRLTRFQRYALLKLSRKSRPNHDFIPAMTEFGLAKAR